MLRVTPDNVQTNVRHQQRPALSARGVMMVPGKRLVRLVCILAV
jgi:hypothetical protein